MTGSATSNAKGYVTFEFELPVYGGHRYRVAAKTDSMKVSVESGPITVWRKVFYQISEMDPPAGASFNFKANKGMIAALRSSLKPVYIALEKGVVARDRLPFQEHFSYTERSKVEAQLKPKAQDVRVPFKFNIVMIDKSDIWNSPENKPIITTQSFSTRPFRYYDGIIHNQHYREVGTSTWHYLSNVRFDPPNPAPWDTVQIHADLPGFVAGKKYEIYLQYDEATGYAGGWGGQTGTLFLCVGRARRQNFALPHVQDLQQVLAHELGHALGLVPQAAGWHDTDARDHKYSLKHCDIGKKTPRCVMWFQLSVPGGTDKAERYHFCDFAAPHDCAHFLMGIPMTDSDLKWLK